MPHNAVLATNRLDGGKSAITTIKLTFGTTGVGATLVLCDLDLSVTSNSGSVN